MRMIGFVNDEDAARRFCDYLLTRRVAAHAEEVRGGAWQVWVEDDDQLDTANAELAAFRAAPDDPKYAATGQAEKLRKLEYAAAKRRQRNFKDVRTTMFSAPNAAAMPVALTIIAACVAVGLLTQFGNGGERVLRYLLFDDPMVQPDVPARLAIFDSVARGQLWRLVTPAFIHYGIFHLIFNMLWMLDLGRRIEPVRGGLRFALLALTIAVLSNTAQAAWAALSPLNADHYTLFGGMSGVVSGLFGYAWMCGKYRPYERIGVSGQETGYMIGWLVICSTGFVGPIANAAHWGGLLVGMAIGAGPSLIKRRR